MDGVLLVVCGPYMVGKYLKYTIIRELIPWSFLGCGDMIITKYLNLGFVHDYNIDLLLIHTAMVIFTTTVPPVVKMK